MEVASAGEEPLDFFSICLGKMFSLQLMRTADEIVCVELRDRLYSTDLTEILENGMRDAFESNFTLDLKVSQSFFPLLCKGLIDNEILLLLFGNLGKHTSPINIFLLQFIRFNASSNHEEEDIMIRSKSIR
jgi:hypothetical protein